MTYRAPWWIRNPHLQTVWPALARRPPSVALRRERIELPDGDFVDLDWAGSERGPLVIVLHGLEGSSRSPYVRGLLAALLARGWRGVVLHFRGCSGEPNRLPRAYHSGETQDLDHVISLLRAREPGVKLAAVGYSLGGNVLLKWLGEQRSRATLAAAVAVCVPLVLSDAAARLHRGFSRLYEKRLLHCLKRSFAAKSCRVAMPLGGRAMVGLRSMRDFDERVTAPLHGFAGADDYYRRSSSRPFLPHIAVPTLIVHALDDPFMTAAVIPAHAELASSITLEVSRHGGHVGFVQGTPWRPSYWLEERIPRYLAPFFGPVSAT